jgi:hypothetical protein
MRGESRFSFIAQFTEAVTVKELRRLFPQAKGTLRVLINVGTLSATLVPD